jgi:hypothetical protein
MAAPLERLFSGQHLVQDGSKRENICAGVGVFPFELLRGHVLERADDRALRRQPRRRRRQHRETRAGCHNAARLREPEVQQLRDRCPRRPSAPRQKNVAGLEVAMDDACAMRARQSIRYLHRVRQRLIKRDGAFLQPIGQRLAFQKLHDEEISGVLAADVVKRTDVGMVERRDRARFLVEPLTELRIDSQRFRQHFDRDDAIESSVAGFVDLAHPARAKGRDDFVGTQPRSR